MNKNIGITAIALLLVIVIAGCNAEEPRTGNLNRTVVNANPAECSLILFQCEQGMKPWFSEEGCGCEKIPENQSLDRTVVSNNPAQCEVIRFTCEPGMQPWFSQEGCGCEKEVRIPEGQMNLCAATSWMEGACTMEYRPVCGWFDESVQCLTYPCAQTYSNPCMACTNEQVRGWTEGECPRS
jgi:hypothetical protein